MGECAAPSTTDCATGLAGGGSLGLNPESRMSVLWEEIDLFLAFRRASPANILHTYKWKSIFKQSQLNFKEKAPGPLLTHLFWKELSMQPVLQLDLLRHFLQGVEVVVKG